MSVPHYVDVAGLRSTSKDSVLQAATRKIATTVETLQTVATIVTMTAQTLPTILQETVRAVTNVHRSQRRVAVDLTSRQRKRRMTVAPAVMTVMTMVLMTKETGMLDVRLQVWIVNTV